jgi:hypothetical protein
VSQRPRALTLRPQEIPLTDPQSCNYFRPAADKPFAATPAALEAFGLETVLACLARLQRQAAIHQGLDSLQVFEDRQSKQRLWFIEDGPGGCITALLPSDY